MRQGEINKQSEINLPQGDFWNDLPVEVKQLINTAKEQLDRGEGIPHAGVMKEVKARFLSR